MHQAMQSVPFAQPPALPAQSLLHIVQAVPKLTLLFSSRLMVHAYQAIYALIKHILIQQHLCVQPVLLLV